MFRFSMALGVLAGIAGCAVRKAEDGGSDGPRGRPGGEGASTVIVEDGGNDKSATGKESGSSDTETDPLTRLLNLSHAEIICGPGHPALAPLEKRMDIGSVLVNNWHRADAWHRKRLLGMMVRYAEIAPGETRRPTRRPYPVRSARVARSLVRGLDDESVEVAQEAVRLLTEKVDEGVLRGLSKAMVETVARRGLCPILLLGRTGSQDAEALLRARDASGRGVARSVDLALAKLGDTALQTRFIDEYKNETRPEMKRRIVRYDLGYIGSESCCRALAEDLRTPLIVGRSRGPRVSLRVTLIEALSRALPDERILWQPRVSPKDDSYYAEIEKWAEERYGIVWKRERPEFLYEYGAWVRFLPRR